MKIILNIKIYDKYKKLLYVFNNMKDILPYLISLVNLLSKLNQDFERDERKLEREIKILNIKYARFKDNIEQEQPKEPFIIYNIWKPKNDNNK